MADTTAAPIGGAADGANYIARLYTEQRDRWAFCRDMREGTEALRRNADIYLLKGPAETPAEFEDRVQRSELFPMFGTTIEGMTGLVFQKDPQLGDDVPAQIRSLAENIDNAGTHFAVFAREVFEDGLTVGHAGILVDAPRVPDEFAGQRLMVGDAQRLGIRPYMLHYKAEQIINWRVGRINGITVLTLLVLREETEEEAGEFSSTIVIRYRVYRRNLASGVVEFATYTLAPDALPGKEPEIETPWTAIPNITAIPFSVFYAGRRRAPLVSFPPLMELAYTNLAHAQVSSDRRTSLHAASSPILVFIGREQASPGEDPNAPPIDATQLDPADPRTAEIIATINGRGEGVVPLGPNIGFDLPMGGDAKYVEHGGKALDASNTELANLERRAAAQGLSILSPDPKRQETAEAKHLDATQRDAALSRAQRSMKDALEQALAFVAQFMGERTGGSVVMSADFQTTVLDDATFANLSKATLAGQISLPTFWAILKAGQRLPDDFSPERELELLREQASGMPGADAALQSGSDLTGAPADANGAPSTAPTAGGSGDMLPKLGGPNALQGLPSSVDRTDPSDEPPIDPATTGGSIGAGTDLTADIALGGDRHASGALAGVA